MKIRKPYIFIALTVKSLCMWAWAIVAMAGEPPESQAVDGAGFTIRRPDHTNHSNTILCTLKWEPNDDITSIIFSPDGSRLLTAVRDVHFSAGLDTSSSSLQALSPTITFSGRLPEVILWDALTGEKLHVFNGLVAPAHSLAYSLDGRRVALGSSEGYVPDHDLKRATVPHRYSGRELTVHSVGGLVRVWDTLTGRELQSLSVPGRGVGAVAFSSDGILIQAFSSGYGITAWNSISGRVDHSFKLDEEFQAMHTREGGFPKLSIDWRHLVILSKGHLLFGDFSPGRTGHFRVIKPAETMSPAWSVAISPDGSHFVSGSIDGSIRLWEFWKGECLRVAKPQEGGGGLGRSGTDTLTLLTFSPDGTRFVSGTGDGLVRVWDAANGRQIQTIEGPKGGVIAATFRGERLRLISGGSTHGRFDRDPRSGLLLREPLNVWETEIQRHTAQP